MSKKVDLNAPGTQSYLTILQGVISRMATNSASAKTWCIALVSAVLVVVAETDKPKYAWLAAIPTALFFLLDAYYLGLERRFREQYNTFITKLHEGEATVDDLFIVAPPGSFWHGLWVFLKATVSPSVLPFYLVLLLMVVLAQRLVL